ncbi:MAG: hypothetical protein F6K41_26020 [Symploca sp. SIO3E6]|nr:hypothetical protein [Caldora sp. SIO3E6]
MKEGRRQKAGGKKLPSQYCSVKRVWGVWGVWEVWEEGKPGRGIELIRAVLGSKFLNSSLWLTADS